MTHWAWLILALALSFLLSALESAILSASGVRVYHRGQNSDNPGARRLATLFDNRDRILASVLLLNDVVTLATFALVTIELVAALAHRRPLKDQLEGQQIGDFDTGGGVGAVVRHGDGEGDQFTNHRIRVVDDLPQRKIGHCDG